MEPRGVWAGVAAAEAVLFLLDFLKNCMTGYRARVVEMSLGGDAWDAWDAWDAMECSDE